MDRKWVTKYLFISYFNVRTFWSFLQFEVGLVNCYNLSVYLLLILYIVI